VVEAYGQLVAEGYLLARRGSGTRVAERLGPAPRRLETASASLPTPRWDLFAGHGDLTLFPRTAWLRATREVLAELPAARLGYGWPGGAFELREALSERLARARGAATSPEHIVIVSGFLHGLEVLARVLLARGATRIAVEEPGFPLCTAVLRAAGLQTVAVPVDAEGLCVERLEATAVDAVVVTPAHAFPVGVVLTPERRAALLRWAEEHRTLIVEDDYDGEFRYDRGPVGTLQGVSPERVVLAGSVSKTLAPAVRIGWLALPEELVAPAIGARSIGADTAAVGQLALARLIGSGAYDRHLRCCRLRYKRKREALLTAIADHVPGARVHGVAAGLHVVLELPHGAGEVATTRAAAALGLRVYPLALFCAGEPRHAPSLVIGYAGCGEGALRDAIGVLAEAIDRAHADAASDVPALAPRDHAPASSWEGAPASLWAG
jgi:GntR family transcriptional regulator/MocR family aminotransferase